MSKRVIVLSPYESEATHIQEQLPESYSVSYFDDSIEMQRELQQHPDQPFILALSTKIEDRDSLEFVSFMTQAYANVDVLVYSSSSRIEEVLLYLKRGALDYKIVDGDYGPLIEAIEWAGSRVDDKGRAITRRSIIFEVIRYFSQKEYEGEARSVMDKFHEWMRSQSQQLEDRKVLIVEDEPLYLKMLEDMAGGTYKVHGVDSAKKALEAYKKERQEVIVVDLFLPDMDGLDLIKAIRNISTENKVIVITAFDVLDRAVDLFREGVIDYINKPILKDAFLTGIHQAIEQFDSDRLKDAAIEKFFQAELSREEQFLLIDLLCQYKNMHEMSVEIDDVYWAFPDLKVMQIPEHYPFPKTNDSKSIQQFVEELL